MEGQEHLKEWLAILSYYDPILTVPNLGYINSYGKIAPICKIKPFIILVGKKYMRC